MPRGGRCGRSRCRSRNRSHHHIHTLKHIHPGGSSHAVRSGAHHQQLTDMSASSECTVNRALPIMSHVLSAVAGAGLALVGTALARRCRKQQIKQEIKPEPNPQLATAAPPYEVVHVPMPHPEWKPGMPQPPPFPATFLSLDPTTVPKGDMYAFLISAVTPRPIALISSRSKEGHVNLAPYSYFNAMGHAPPVICIGINRSSLRGGGKKDSLENIESTGEFVVNIMSDWFIEAANHSCGDFPPGVDELALAGLHQVPSQKINAPRVREAAIHMECKLRQVVNVDDETGKPSTAIVIGEVVLFHVAEGVTSRSPNTGKLVVDPVKLKPVGRMGGTMYCRVTQLYDLGRPKADQATLGPAEYTASYVQLLQQQQQEQQRPKEEQPAEQHKQQKQ